MTVLTRKPPGRYQLDGRSFALFLLCQALVVAGALLVTERLPLLLFAALVAGLYLLASLSRPWLIVPLLMLATALDSTGRLLHTADVVGGLFYLTGFHLVSGLLVMALAIHVSLTRRRRFPDFEVKEPLILFLGCIAVSLIYSPNQPEATVSFFRLCALALFAYMIQIVIDSRRTVSLVIWTMAALTVGGAVMGTYQVVTGRFHLPVTVITALGGNVPRGTGTFANPNIFAAFLMSGVLPLLAVLLNHRPPLWQRLLLALSILVGVGGLLTSFSRSSWVAMGVGVMVLLWLSGKLRYFFLVLFASILLVLGLREFVPFAEYIYARFISIFTLFEEFGSIGRTSSTARVYLMIASLHMFLDNPLLGIGWRAFPDLFPKYAPAGYPHWTYVNESHTVVTMVLGELGIVGFLAFLWFVARTFLLSLRRFHQMRDPYLRAVTIGLISAFVAFQVNQSFNGDLSNNMFWFYVGMLFSVQRIEAASRSP